MVRHLVELIGNFKLVELKMRDLGFAPGKLAKRLSTRSVRLARMILIQAIRNAMVNDPVVCGMRRNWLPCPAKLGQRAAEIVETESGPV